MARKNDTSKLYRSESNKVIAGVCGGLGEYFDFDPVILRVIFVVLSVFGGSGFLLYIILWLVVPTKSNPNDSIKENAEEIKLESQKLVKKGNSKIVFGAILILIGLSILSENLGFYVFREFWKFWPVVLIILGISVMTNKH